MSLTNSPYWFGGGVDSFYPTQINDSLRFNDDDSAYLNRTPSTASNRTTWTWSGWVKRGNLGGTQAIFSTATTNDVIYFNSNNNLTFYTTGNYYSVPPNLFRDTSAWYHFVFVWDTTNGTQADRMRVYVNGERLAFGTGTQAALNATSGFNNNVVHGIGYAPYVGSYYLDGYLSNIHFIDGQALDPTSFGEAKDGTWIPKPYSGSYGTNGFHLEFNGNTNDTSGNGNNWTANNISAHDYVPDSPTNNFATLNTLDNFAYLAEGNLYATRASTSTGHYPAMATITANSGKYYFEALVDVFNGSGNDGYVGVVKSDELPDYTLSNFIAIKPRTFYNDIRFATNGVGASLANDTLLFSGCPGGTIVNVAVDLDAGSIWLGKNGTWYNSGNPSAGTNATSTFTVSSDFKPFVTNQTGSSGSNTQETYINFGQDSTFAGSTTAGGNTDANGIGDFKHSVPSGFLALASANLPEPTIIDGSTAFSTALFTGTGSTRSVTSLSFQPDFTWFKRRDGAVNHALYDVIRGDTNALRSNTTGAEAQFGDAVVTFQSDGFEIAGTNVSGINGSGESIASWNWKAGTAFSNSAGSNGATIASSGSVNTDAGFSIVSYTGNATNGATIYHGLGVAPDFIIHKNRSVTDDWSVWSSALPNTTGYKLLLNSSSAQQTTSNYPTLPTSSVFYVGAGQEVNGNTHNMIAYCFADVEGYSKAGSYTGGGANSSFVHIGFRPSLVITKASSASSNWMIFDSKREPYNWQGLQLYPNLANSEFDGADNRISFHSNGFLLDFNSGETNGSGVTYIYLAFAESPQKYANAR